jgi:hypothetical protein
MKKKKKKKKKKKAVRLYSELKNNYKSIAKRHVLRNHCIQQNEEQCVSVPRTVH